MFMKYSFTELGKRIEQPFDTAVESKWSWSYWRRDLTYFIVVVYTGFDFTDTLAFEICVGFLPI